MAFTGSVVSITSTAIVTIASNTGNGPADVSMEMTSGTAYLGAATVTTAGYALTTASARFTVSIMPGEALYGAASSASVGMKKLIHSGW